MITLVERQRDALAEICVRRHVRRLDVFGSAVKETFDEQTSDLDFLVDLGDYELRVSDRYFGLVDDLERLFDRPVDLITVKSIRSPSFRAEIDETREAVFVADDAPRTRIEASQRIEMGEAASRAR